jgi:hypothetical protein
MNRRGGNGAILLVEDNPDDSHGKCYRGVSAETSRWSAQATREADREGTRGPSHAGARSENAKIATRLCVSRRTVESTRPI